MAIVPTIGGKNILHPGVAYSAALRLRTPVDFWGQANSYNCPLGPEPGSAWLLMLRKDLDGLGKDSFHTLKWTDGSRRLTIPSLAIVRSTTMNRALGGDLKAARLVEFQDKRRQFKWSSIDSQYNVRIPAPSVTSGVGLYYTDSIDTSVVWTWQTMLTKIWGSLPGTPGAAPTLPYTPDGTPEGFRFIGVSAWDAIHAVLKKIGCTSAYDPIADTFSYVRLGTTQTGLAGTLRGLAKRLMYDYDPGDDYQLANMPEKVRVFFHRREVAHGIEKDTPDSGNWEMAPAVSKVRATNITGAISASVMAVWDDLPALFDTAGTNTNSAALQARTDEIGDNIRDWIDVSEERLRRMFSGLVTTILPGSEISETRWRDYGDETGLVTEVIRKPRGVSGNASTLAGEHIAPPDLSRGTHPLYPRVSQPVQVDDGTSSTGTELTANGDGLFPGFVYRWAAGAWMSLDACWIRPADLDPDDNEATVIKLRQKDRFVGRLSGTETSGGSTRPVYVVRSGGKPGDLYSISADNGTPVIIDADDTVDFDTTDQDWDTEANSTKADRGLVVQVETDGGDSTIKRLKHAIDKSPLQNVVLSGGNTSGTTPVLVKAGTRNSITFLSSAGGDNAIKLVGGVGTIEFQTDVAALNPLFKVQDDDSPTPDTINVNHGDTVQFTGDGQDTEVLAGPIVQINSLGLVKLRTADTLEILQSKFINWIADADGDRFKSAEDPVVEVQTEGAGPYDLRLFINSSDITGYSASGELHLALDSNVLKWLVPPAQDGKVKVRTTDVADFLETQFIQWIADADGDRFKSAEDLLIEFQTEGAAGSEQLRAFVNSSDITGYSASGELHLALDANVLKWIVPPIHDGTVKVRTTDVLGFLETQFAQWIADADGDRFKSAEDPLIEFQTEGAAGSEQLRAFINSSDITGYSASGELHLALDSNVLKWLTPAANDGRVKVRTTDVLGFLETQLVQWIADADGDRFKSAEDPLVEFQTEGAAGSEQIRAFINSSDITGYSASGELHLALDSNVLKWIPPTALYTFTIDADVGFTSVINDANTLLFQGTVPAGTMPSAADRGIVTNIVAGVDTLEISVDASVMQKATLIGSASTGTLLVLVSAGTRNNINFNAAGTSSTVLGSATGYIELNGAPGEIELILHPGHFTVQSDNGSNFTIQNTNILTLEGDIDGIAASLPGDRGIVTTNSVVDTVEFSVNETVHQKSVLAGSGTNAATVLIGGGTGTRNVLHVKSVKTTTVTESAGIDGWVQINGNANGELEFILHQQLAAAYTFTIDADVGGTSVINNANTLLFQGTVPAGTMPTAANRGIVTNIVAGVDTLEIAVDASVMQEVLLTGSGTSGNNTIPIENGTRNQLRITSSTTPGDNVENAYLEVKGAAAQADIEMILRRDGKVRVRSGDAIEYLEDKFIPWITDADGDRFKTDPDIVIEFQTEGAAGFEQLRAFVNSSDITDYSATGTVHLSLNEDKLKWVTEYSFIVDGDLGGTETIKSGNTLLFEGTVPVGALAPLPANRGIVSSVGPTGKVILSVDASVHQETVLSGTAATGTLTLPIEAGTRNRLDIKSNKSATVQETTESKGYIEVKGGASGDFELILHERPSVPIGFVGMGIKATKLSGAKRYLDRDGVADTDWALMDGVSNVTPGSGIQIATHEGTEKEFFVRGLHGTAAATNTRFGRDSTALTADPDDDEVEISDHIDHFHKMDMDTCDDDSGSTFFKFSTASKRTSGVLDSSSNPDTLIHVLANHQGSAGDRIEMTPDHKKLHYFERVA